MADLELNEPDVTPGEDNGVLESTAQPVEPDVATTPQVGNNEEVEALKASFERGQAQAEARLQQLENLLVSIAERRQANEPAPSEEEIDYDDPAALYKISERLVNNRTTQLESKVDEKLRALQVREFNANVRELNKEHPDVVKRFKNEIEDYYRNNPNERYNPDSYGIVLNHYMGELYKEQQRKRRPAPSSPNPAAPTGPSPAPPKAPEWDPQEERLARIYGMMEGKDIIDLEEWNTIKEDRRKFPGRRGGR